MKTVKLISISDLKTEKSRTDGKLSRQYYTAYFMDALNPFAKQQQRNFFEDHNSDGTSSSWKVGNPAVVKQFIGKEIPGQIINSNVETYVIDGRDVNSFTTVLLDGEKLETVLKQSGRVLLGYKPVSIRELIESNTILPISSGTALNK